MELTVCKCQNLHPRVNMTIVVPSVHAIAYNVWIIKLILNVEQWLVLVVGVDKTQQ